MKWGKFTKRTIVANNGPIFRIWLLNAQNLSQPVTVKINSTTHITKLIPHKSQKSQPGCTSEGCTLMIWAGISSGSFKDTTPLGTLSSVKLERIELKSILFYYWQIRTGYSILQIRYLSILEATPTREPSSSNHPSNQKIRSCELYRRTRCGNYQQGRCFQQGRKT